MELPSPRKKPKPKSLASLNAIRPILAAKLDDDQVSAPRKKTSPIKKGENIKIMNTQ